MAPGRTLNSLVEPRWLAGSRAAGFHPPDASAL